LHLEIYNRIDIETGNFKTSLLTPSIKDTRQIVVDVIEGYQAE